MAFLGHTLDFQEKSDRQELADSLVGFQEDRGTVGIVVLQDIVVKAA